MKQLAKISTTGEFSKVLGGFLLVMVLYFGAVFVSNYFASRSPYSKLSEERRSIQAALLWYQKSERAYPVFFTNADVSIEELKKFLVSVGHLPASSNLSTPDNEARYMSNNGKSYGLLFHFRANKASSPSPCIVEAETHATGWWGQPPACPF